MMQPFFVLLRIRTKATGGVWQQTEPRMLPLLSFFVVRIESVPSYSLFAFTFNLLFNYSSYRTRFPPRRAFCCRISGGWRGALRVPTQTHTPRRSRRPQKIGSVTAKPKILFSYKRRHPSHLQILPFTLEAIGLPSLEPHETWYAVVVWRVSSAPLPGCVVISHVRTQAVAMGWTEGESPSLEVPE